MSKPSHPHGELALIQQIRRTFPVPPRSGVSLGIGDDCAILRLKPGHELLITSDFSLEDRHFRRSIHPPFTVGHRCLARGLSDLAAMGATPVAAFLSLALPADLPATPSGLRWISQFLKGFRTLALQTKTPLAGGDTAQSPSNHILADIVLAGQAPSGTALRRSTAHAGDRLYVTGHLGGPAAELRALLAANALARRPRAPARHPHLLPSSRLSVGSTLRRRQLATACIDLSDGLSTDLAHLCEASRLRAEIDAGALPIHPLAGSLPRKEALDLALHGGEDYELLFAAHPATRIPAAIAGARITLIGTLLELSPRKPRILLRSLNGPPRRLESMGWEHFTD